MRASSLKDVVTHKSQFPARHRDTRGLSRFPLQRLHMVGKRRLGNMHRGRRPAKMRFLCHRVEIGEPFVHLDVGSIRAWPACLGKNSFEYGAHKFLPFLRHHSSNRHLPFWIICIKLALVRDAAQSLVMCMT